MSAPLDELYFKWLYRQVGSTREKDPNKTYWSLLRVLFTTEYVWFIRNDDNRLADGVQLRLDFLQDQGIRDVDPDWLSQGCSFLEMMIALSRRLAFQTEGKAPWWFWRLMANLQIDDLVDTLYTPDQERKVNTILLQVIWRTYRSSGLGGLFPLRWPDQDQREVEIWFQMNYYLIENDF